MSSMFENCIGDRWYTFTSGSGSGGTYSRWHGFGNFQLSGLDAWDVSNVENVSRMFASINISKMFDHGPCYERFSYAIEPFVSGGLHN